jgi:PAS domain S-box-containing protein
MKPCPPVDQPYPSALADAAGLPAPPMLLGVLASIDVPLYLLDAERRFLYANRRCREIMGRNAEELVGRRLTEAAPELLGSELERQLAAAQRECRPVCFEAPAPAAPERWFETHVCPSPDSVTVYFHELGPERTAELVRAAGRCLDERDRGPLRWSDEYRAILGEEIGVAPAGERQLHQLFSLLPVGIYTCDAGGRITLFNQRAAEIWGEQPRLHSAEQRFCGAARRFTIDGHELLAAETPMAAALLEGRSCSNAEQIFERPDGSRVVVTSNVMPLRDATGRCCGAINVFQDISDRKQAEQTLREADRRKDEFLAMLAHELRNPLGPIRNGAQLLRYLCPREERYDRAIGIIERQALHMSRLVEELLDVSLITRGKLTLRREQMDLARLVLEVVGDCQQEFERARVQLICEIPTGEVWIRGDRGRLAQALGHLLHNALRCSAVGGRTQVRLELGSGEAALSVQNDGTGYAASELPSLFEPFTPGVYTGPHADDGGAAPAERPRAGVGLGLALVKGLVTLHGGSVAAESAGPDLGARVTMRLPLARCQVQPLAERAAGPGGARRRVLIIEDNRDAAQTLEMLVALWGHEVRTAVTGRDGLAIAEAWAPEVVLCDIGLPEMDGYAVCQALRRNRSTESAFMVALTGYGRAIDVERAMDAGFALHLTKPVEPQKLERLLSDCSLARPQTETTH